MLLKRLFENFQAFSGHSFLNQIWRNVPEPLLLVRIRIFLLPTSLFLLFITIRKETAAFRAGESSDLARWGGLRIP